MAKKKAKILGLIEKNSIIMYNGNTFGVVDIRELQGGAEFLISMIDIKTNLINHFTVITKDSVEKELEQ